MVRLKRWVKSSPKGRCPFSHEIQGQLIHFHNKHVRGALIGSNFSQIETLSPASPQEHAAHMHLGHQLACTGLQQRSPPHPGQ